jgi:hypothetical protein
VPAESHRSPWPSGSSPLAATRAAPPTRSSWPPGDFDAFAPTDPTGLELLGVDDIDNIDFVNWT